MKRPRLIGSLRANRETALSLMALLLKWCRQLNITTTTTTVTDDWKVGATKRFPIGAFHRNNNNKNNNSNNKTTPTPRQQPTCSGRRDARGDARRRRVLLFDKI